MAISVAVPKDLSGIKTKVIANFTKRQVVCFGGAALTGIPFYIFTKGVWYSVKKKYKLNINFFRNIALNSN